MVQISVLIFAFSMVSRSREKTDYIGVMNLQVFTYW